MSFADCLSAANQAAVAAAATAVAADPLQQAYTGMQQYAGQYAPVEGKCIH